jgi:hypothetical protein
VRLLLFTLLCRSPVPSRLVAPGRPADPTKARPLVPPPLQDLILGLVVFDDCHPSAPPPSDIRRSLPVFGDTYRTLAFFENRNLDPRPWLAALDSSKHILFLQTHAHCDLAATEG